jgi:hypothetical protein
MKQFITHSVHFFSYKKHTESNEKYSFNMCLNLSSFKNFCLAIQKGRSRSRSCIKIFPQNRSRIKMSCIISLTRAGAESYTARNAQTESNQPRVRWVHIETRTKIRWKSIKITFLTEVPFRLIHNSLLFKCQKFCLKIGLWV